MGKLYSIEALENTIHKFHDQGWDITQLNEGTLLAGDYLFEKEGYKSVIFMEKYLNEWSSAYIVKRFDTTKKRSHDQLHKLIYKLRGHSNE